uniref:RPE-retinal G protein-coupled receptor n=1 Tax=Papio anubis TaxID=9555 RepID=A0A8I5R8U0_PAPAN
MAETSALPTGFGELEVLAVGMVLLVEALSGLSLNTLTIFSFCKTPELRTPCHLLVLSLALADSGISLNALIAATSSLLRRWPYGSDGCQAHGFQGFVTALASICSSAAIAWGRYHHYCTRSQLAWNSAISLVLFVWLSSTFWAALPLLGWGHYDYEPLGTCCTLDYSKGDRNFTSFLFTMSFFNFAMPLFITITSYSLMEQKLGKSGHLQVRTPPGVLSDGAAQPQALGVPNEELDVTHTNSKANIHCFCSKAKQQKFIQHSITLSERGGRTDLCEVRSAPVWCILGSFMCLFFFFPRLPNL